MTDQNDSNNIDPDELLKQLLNEVTNKYEEENKEKESPVPESIQKLIKKLKDMLPNSTVIINQGDDDEDLPDEVREALAKISDSKPGEPAAIAMNSSDPELRGLLNLSGILRSVCKTDVIPGVMGGVVVAKDEDDPISLLVKDGKQPTQEELLPAVMEMINRQIDKMIEETEDPKRKQLASLMAHRHRTGKNSPASDQAVISLLKETNAMEGDSSLQAYIMMIADHHVVTWHGNADMSEQLMDLNKLTKSESFTNLFTTLNAENHFCLHLAEEFLEGTGQPNLQLLTYLLMSMYVKGLLVGHLLGTDGAECLAGDVHVAE